MEQFKGLRAPFGWVGGKSKLAASIADLLPPHLRYVEVFGGALSVLYHKTPSKIEIVNDVNSELINLHRIIRTAPQSLQACLNALPRSREIFYDIKFGRAKPRNNVERAAFYFYLIGLSFGSKGEHFAMPRGRATKNIYRDFSVHSRRLRHVVIENMSYERLIATYDAPETLFYLDPPYIGTESYYKSEFDEHEKLAEILRGVRGKFVLSYNDCELARELYKGFEIKPVSVRYTLNQAHAKTCGEILVVKG